MLVITRRDGESLFIGNTEIQVKVLDVKGNQVKIGVSAPKDVLVFREELAAQFLGSAQPADAAA